LNEDAGKGALTRREFAVGGVGAALLLSGNYAWAQGSGTIKVGLIGCGGRGNGAVRNCAQADPSIEIVALGDVFPDRLNGTRAGLARDLKERFKATDATCFTGFDAYKGVIGSGVDLVILATPPGFRPGHFAAAIAAGKHVFMEKPVAVDPVGIRSVIATSEIATQKGLAVVAGTQRRHQANYLATMERIHKGEIGEIFSGSVYWNQGGLWMNQRQPDWSDMEWQLRNWLYFTWLSGDHIVEQHVHNLDVANWALKSHPVKAYGMGGRQVRTDPAYGHIFDHFAIEYVYPNGARIQSFCRQIDGTASRVSEFFTGTKGTTDGASWIQKGKKRWKFETKDKNKKPLDPYVEEHVDLIASIKAGKPLNEGKQIAESTLTAIMGRQAAYSGQEIQWDAILNSDLDLMPKALEMGPLPIPPVAVPGRTRGV
jgi:predicted dehydrogenase